MRADATCYRHPDRRAAVACQRCDRPICTACMSEASVGFHCPEDAKAGRQQVYTSSALFGRAAGRPVVTLALVAVNVAVFVLGFGRADELRLDFGLIAIGRVGPELIGVDQGEWYRLVSSGFLHANLLHLGFNMYLLYVLGQMLEPELGRVRFALTYAFSLLTGSLGVLLVDPTALTVGASGAVFGLMGMAFVAQRSRGINPFDTGLGGLIVLNLMLTFLVPGISVGGHVGGLVGGLVAAGLLVSLPGSAPRLPAFLPSLALVALGAAAVAGSLWAAAQWMDPLF